MKVIVILQRPHDHANGRPFPNAITRWIYTSEGNTELIAFGWGEGITEQVGKEIREVLEKYQATEYELHDDRFPWPCTDEQKHLITKAVGRPASNFSYQGGWF